MPKDEPDKAGVIIPPHVLQAARDRKQKSRAANPASSDATQRDSKSRTCNRGNSFCHRLVRCPVHPRTWLEEGSIAELPLEIAVEDPAPRDPLAL